MEDFADRSSEAVEVAAGNLRVDVGTAEVLRAFEAEGVESILLKGRSIATWLYSPTDPRPYRDCDVLVAPTQMQLAEAALAKLGFERRFDDAGMPDWWREHAGEWRRPEDGMSVDLHRTLPGIGVDAETAWSVLAASTETGTVGGHPALALAAPAKALHVALHAAQHGVEWHKPMADLERALLQIDASVWRRAADLAERLAATESFAAGLRLSAAGRELAVRLELPDTASVEAALRASSAPVGSLGFEQLSRTSGSWARASFVWRKLVPPREFMRKWHPMASQGRLGLLRAYLWRPIWMMRAAPRGLRAWRRARRHASGD